MHTLIKDGSLWALSQTPAKLASITLAGYSLGRKRAVPTSTQLAS